MDNLARSFEPEMWTELLNGKIVAMSPRPSVNHNIVSLNIARIFANFLHGKTCMAFGDGVDVFLSEKDRVIPDAMIVCNRNIIKQDGIHGAPDLVVEVLSPSTTSNDRGYKRKQYAKAGVKEYWLVDPVGQALELYLPEDNNLEFYHSYGVIPEYELSKMTDDEKSRIETQFISPTFPDLNVNLIDVFYGMI